VVIQIVVPGHDGDGGSAEADFRQSEVPTGMMPMGEDDVALSLAQESPKSARRRQDRAAGQRLQPDPQFFGRRTYFALASVQRGDFNIALSGPGY